MLVSVLLAIGCTRFEESADFIYVAGGEPDTFDPALTTSVGGGRLAAALFEGLTTYNPRDISKPEPGVARRWEVSEDRKIYMFFLRKTTWSNGKPVTADDFVQSWERVLNPVTGSKYASIMYCIKGAEAYNKGETNDFSTVGVEAVDPLTLRVTLREVTPFFLDLTSFATFMPVNSKCVGMHGRLWIKPGNIVTNGPYLLESWHFNYKFRLRKNPSYWNSVRVKTAILDIFSVEDTHTGFNIYETGGAHLITSVPDSLLRRVNKRRDFHACPAFGTYFYRFNCRVKPLDDVRVRRALALAINRKRIAEKIKKGGEEPAYSFVPPGAGAYTSPKWCGFDPKKAARLLAEAGYPDGRNFPSLHLLYNTSKSHENAAKSICSMWRKHLNIDVGLKNQEWKVFLDTTVSLEYEISRGGWYGDYLHPFTFLDIMRSDDGNNRTGWKNAEYDALLKKAKTVTQTEERLALMKQAEEILSHEQPVIPIFFIMSQFMYRSNVQGVYTNSRGIVMLRDAGVENP